jgi:uncharacterized protein YfaS (alpha-2-macroglobulin family)
MDHGDPATAKKSRQAHGVCSHGQWAFSVQRQTDQFAADRFELRLQLAASGGDQGPTARARQGLRHLYGGPLNAAGVQRGRDLQNSVHDVLFYFGGCLTQYFSPDQRAAFAFRKC